VRTAGSRAVVVDTNVFGAELTRRGEAVDAAYQRHVGGRDLVISFITAAELRYGARLAGWGAQRLARLETRLAVAEIVWAGDGLVDEYVSLRHECAVSGHPLGQKHHEADRWIAATARWLGVALVAHDTVFRDTPGLRVITELA
jgi:predicted nucleic acid-binding protein